MRHVNICHVCVCTLDTWSAIYMQTDERHVWIVSSIQCVLCSQMM